MAVGPPGESPSPSDERAVALSTIDGLDAQRGLARVGGNEPLYRRLLLRFCELHHDDVDRIRAALRSGDRPVAAGAAHQLCGVAATLGLVEIETLSRDLQHRLREADPAVDLTAEAEPLGIRLASLVAAIRERITPPA